MNKNSILELIRSRRSIRKFKTEEIPEEIIYEILEAGIWAPSGMNNQPWKFIILKDRDFRDRISRFTKYSKIITAADFCIAVFYNKPAGYDRDKDLMAIGSCIQNMLLYSFSAGIGSVWLGEILKNKQEVNRLLEVDESCEFMALLAFGIPDEKPSSERSDITTMLLKPSL
ncbi:MAG TPA: nitroreductase family protein [Spirochaetota bacterium]|nr:nitroreductase family protein [Spirochaetota bacterium]